MITCSVLAAIAFAHGAAAQPAGDVEYRSYLAHLGAAEASLRLNDTSAVRRWLDGAPQVHRGWEWQYLSAQSDQSVGTLGGPLGATILELDFSPDGMRVAGACEDGVVVVRSLETGREQLRLSAHIGEAFRARFSPDGSLLATSGRDKLAKVWDSSTGALISEFRGFDTPVTGIDFSPDGTRVASCNYRIERGTSTGAVVTGTIKVWDPRSGSELRTFSAGDKPLSMIRWSPDGARVACSSWNGSAYVFDVASGAQVLELPLPDEGTYNALNSIGFSPDGRFLVAGSKDRTARVWDAASGEPLATLRHEGWVTGTAFAPDGSRLATASHDGLIRLWDPTTWKHTATLRGHTAGPWTLAFSPEGALLLSGGVDRTIRAWDVRYDDYGSLRRTDSDACYAALWSPDGRRLYTGAYDGTLSVWEAATGQLIARWSAHPGSSTNILALSADGRTLASCSWDKTVRIWDPDTGSLATEIAFDAGVYNVALSPDGRLAAAAPRNRTVVVAPVDGAPVRVFEGLGGNATCLAFDPTGTRLGASLGDSTVRIWTLEEGREVLVLRGHEGPAQACAFSPDGARLATSGNDGRVILWDAQRGHQVWATRVADSGVHRVTFSPDGSRLAAGTRDCPVLDVRTGEVVLSLRPHNDTTWNLMFSPDGAALASCSTDGSITISDAATIPERIERRRAAVQAAKDAIDLVNDHLAAGVSPSAIPGRLRDSRSHSPELIAAVIDELLRRAVPPFVKEEGP